MPPSPESSSDENSVTATERALEQQGVIRHVQSYLGADYVFAATVSRLWKDTWSAGEEDAARNTTLSQGARVAAAHPMHGLPLKTSLASAMQSLRRLTWALDCWLEWNEAVSMAASRSPYYAIELLEYGLGTGHICLGNTPVNAKHVCLGALIAGNLETLKWADEVGFPRQKEAEAFHAVFHGHLTLLKWLRADGCRFNAVMCTTAAGSGRLEMLQWLRSQGCPWTHSACAAARAFGKVAVLEWAHANGSPCSCRRDVASANTAAANS